MGALDHEIAGGARAALAVCALGSALVLACGPRAAHQTGAAGKPGEAARDAASPTELAPGAALDARPAPARHDDPDPPIGGMRPTPSPLGGDVAVDATAELTALLPAADAAPGGRVRRATAVVLFAPPRSPDADPSTPRVFQPLVCAIRGKRATGARCGEAMPARATIRTSSGALEVGRSTQPFHDEAGGHDYPAPYGPACCMYNTCSGRTVPYRAVTGGGPSDPRAQLAVWPADAEVELEVAAPGLAGVRAEELAVRDGARVDQAFARGAHRYAALRSRSGGAVQWNVGRGWVTAQSAPGPRGHALLATVDVDRDGRRELISYQLWANDYGLDVFGDGAAPIYGFGCGNI